MLRCAKLIQVDVPSWTYLVEKFKGIQTYGLVAGAGKQIGRDSSEENERDGGSPRAAVTFVDAVVGSISMPMRTYEQVRLTNYVSNKCLARFALR